MDHGLARSALAFLPTLPQIFLCGIAIPVSTSADSGIASLQLLPPRRGIFIPF